MRILSAILIFLLIAGLVIGTQALYTVDVTQQVVITRFGQPQRTIQEPGLHTKTPFVEEVHRFERRLLRLDTAPEEFLTSDKKALVIDTYSRYLITDPLEFFRRLVTESQASVRLSQIIASEVREAIGERTQKDIITEGRVRMMSQVTERSREKTEGFGVRIVEVRIKRADFPQDVAASVYNRMRSERQKEANLLRAEGDRDARRIRSEADVTVARTVAEAERLARQIRGRAEAQAIDALAEALQQDSEFYAFLRSLEAYEQALGSRDTIILSSDSDLLRFLTDKEGKKTEESASP